MLKLRKILHWCFGNVALVFPFASISSISTFPTLLLLGAHRHLYANANGLASAKIAANLLAKLIQAIPVPLTFLYGNGVADNHAKKSIREAMAIAASVAMLVLNAPLLILNFYGQIVIFIIVLHGAALVVGIAGLVAFGRRDPSSRLPIKTAKLPRIAGRWNQHSPRPNGLGTRSRGSLCGMVLVGTLEP